jgi:nicotinamide mononucleotide adenylyltransferase
MFPRHKLQLQGITKTPIVLVACGSYSPVTYLHLRMFEMAHDYFAHSKDYQLIGAYFSPVSDAYSKPGLAPWNHRVKMCELATENHPWYFLQRI